MSDSDPKTPDLPHDPEDSASSESTALEIATDRSLAVPDPLQRYLSEIGRFALLSPEEEKDLAVRYKEYGDTKAAYRLATHNLRLVVHIAMDFRRTAVSLLDLIQEGNIGLLQAVKRFDPYRNVRLSAYASWWIRAYILKYLIDHWSLVRVGTTNTRRKLLFNLKKEKEALEARGIRPEAKTLAKRLGVSESEVIQVQQGMTRDVSIDAPIGPESETPYSEFMQSGAIPADEAIAEQEFQNTLRQKLDVFGETLDERDRDIFTSRLLAEKPAILQEIGDRHGISREAVRQRERKIVARLKDYLRQELSGFTGLDFLRGEEDPPVETAG
jgi:RNA polymerase sigma-32 factor